MYQICFITAVYRYSPLPGRPRPGRGAAGGRPPRAAGRGGSTPGSSRRPGPWWRRARDASASRRGRPRKDCGPAVDRPRDVPVAQDSRFEITWRAVGRLASRPRLLVLSRATTKKSSAPAPPDSTSEAPRSRHGAAQAPRHEGRRVLRDPDLGGELEGGHAPLRPRQQPHGMEPAEQAHLGVLHGRPGHREVAGAPRALPGAVAPGDGRARRAPAPLALPSLRPPDPRQPPLAAPSPGYLAGRARGLPILPFSALTCLRLVLPIVPPASVTLSRHHGTTWQKMCHLRL